MILNVGGRTDIVNHYGEWLMNRFEAGYVCLRNPLFPNKVIRYELAPNKVDAVLFCSKNYLPFLGNAKRLASRYRTYFQYTITPYGKDYEPNIPDLETRAETLLALSDAVGKQRVAWRYEPIFLTDRYPPEAHFRTFEALARKFSGKIDRCIIGFIEIPLPSQSGAAGLSPLTAREKQTVAAGLGRIAASYGFPIQICRSKGYAQYGIAESGCVTLDILGKANGCVFRDVKHNGNRRGCNCIESRDVGFYETCPNLCKYCYANTDAEKVRENLRLHDVRSPLLIGNIKESDTVLKGVQESYLKGDGRQISLFDL